MLKMNDFSSGIPADDRAAMTRSCTRRSWMARVRYGVVCAALALTGLSGGLETTLYAQSTCGPTINPIACENQKPGDPSSAWDISGSGDSSIQGFATEMSVVAGQIQRFKINTNSNNYTIGIYRVGFYGGMGARKVANVTPSVALPQSQPSCLSNGATGLVDCGNWAVSASWTVPADAVSGVYFALLTRVDTGGQSHIFFIVRDDAVNSDIVFQTSDTTWQAYNTYGGNSFYTGSPAGRAYKVSYNRPMTTRGTAPEDFFFNAEYPMVRWLEANGYHVSYISGVDTDRYGATILTPTKHKVFLSIGHDEYWSGAQRANVENARGAGLSLAFLSGNEVFWKTRWENSIDSSNTPYRTLVCYKETHANAPIDPADPPTWTGTWRDPRFSPPADGGRPENALTGTMFLVNTSPSNLAVSVPAAMGKLRLWRNTSVATLPAGGVATMTSGTLGYEWDQEANNGFRPAGLMRLSSTTQSGVQILLDYGSTYGTGTATHNLTLYRHPSGALVFGAGTVQWTWGLDSNHDRGSAAADVRMRQAMVNLFADMDAQPATLQAGLVPATASTDLTAPVSTMTSPTAGASINAGTPVTITGTASDSGGGLVAGVEVSTDNGLTWAQATGTTSWTFNWTAAGSGSVTIRSRAFDDTGNMETPSGGTTITVPAKTCPCTIWNASATPAILDDGDTNAVELGVRFRSEVSGYVTGVRFYKGTAANSGTHIGNLWTNTGTRLGTVTFTGETATGWQQANFSSPIAIAANTTYVVSYFTSVGRYSANRNYFAAAGVDNPPLHALQNGIDGANGVYVYSSSSAFPTQTYQSEFDWVDVVFNTTASDTTPPTVTSTFPTNGATAVDPAVAVTATFSEALDPATMTSVTFELRDPSGNLVPSAVSYNSTTLVATLRPDASLLLSTTYTALARGGATDPRVKDAAGNALQTNVSWSFTTAAAPPPPPACPCSIWSASTVPATIDDGDSVSSELGTKFRSDVAGYVTGARFYKAALNTGTHVARLWTLGGTQLGIATFTGETASGWQQVAFPSAIPIAANTTYIISYRAPNGHYSAPDNYFLTAGVDNPPLHALRDGVDGPNGVYSYGAPGSFPTQTYKSESYFIDVVFSTTVGPTYTISGSISPAGNGSGATVALTGTATATVTADASGNYSFAGLANGSYTVTPSKSGFTFSPVNRAVTISGANATANFTAAAIPTYSISGTISPAASGSGATVALTGAATATVTADASGNYSFAGLANGSYTVTPSKSGFTFSPVNRAVTISGANATANFTAAAIPTYSISGTISPAASGSGATVALTGAATATVTADASGNYSFAGLANGSYTVTPSKSGFTFSPVNRAVTISGANATANFTAAAIPTYSISGTISPAASGSGATVALTGAATATVTADASGNYSFAGLANGAYTVTPSKSGFTFSPVNRAVTISGANATANFTAAASGITIDATVTFGRSNNATTVASGTFSTTSPNQLLLAFVATDNHSGTTTVSNVTGAALTWTLVRRTNTQRGTSEIWRAFAATTLNGVSVTATISQSVSAAITVMSFSGVDTTGTNGSGAIGSTGSGNANPGAPTATLTTTRNNSLVVGVGNDWDNAIARTVGPNQTLVSQYLATIGDTFWVQRTTNPVAVSGTVVTINDTAPTTDRYNLTIAEILAAP